MGPKKIRDYELHPTYQTGSLSSYPARLGPSPVNIKVCLMHNQSQWLYMHPLKSPDRPYWETPCQVCFKTFA